MDGAPTPRVKGFLAHIEPLPDAKPKVFQPFPLSPFDQARMDFHEDEEVFHGKAEWLEPGARAPWASPSFIVDSSHKDILGRPVSDYRWVNTASVDNGWPSPNAEACISRAQRATVLTTCDCVWGFTQIPIDEPTKEMLTLATRRGLLRPNVLYFGVKQGPALFQSLFRAQRSAIFVSSSPNADGVGPRWSSWASAWGGEYADVTRTRHELYANGQTPPRLPILCL